MNYYELNVAGCKRMLPLCEASPNLDIAAFIMFGDVEITENSARELLKKCPEHDVVLSAEAKGIPLCYEMARQGCRDYVIARKSVKLYMTDIVAFKCKSITTAKEQTLYLSGDDVKKLSGKRVLIVDDVISTGDSLLALEELVKKSGGTIVGKALNGKKLAYDKDGKVIGYVDENDEVRDFKGNTIGKVSSGGAIVDADGKVIANVGKTSDIKALAYELDIPIFVISSMNRYADRRDSLEGKRPQLSDLRESGAIEDVADLVMFVHRPEMFHIYQDDCGRDLHGAAQIIIAKNRMGRTGDVLLSFKGDYVRFENPKPF